jgi:hypothetical protein
MTAGISNPEERIPYSSRVGIIKPPDKILVLWYWSMKIWNFYLSHSSLPVMEKKMKKTLALSLLMLIFAISACTPQLTATPAPLPAMTEVTQVPVTETPTVADQSAALKSYTNSAFGLGFQFPSGWFGPEEYISDHTLRVEMGSDKVYPYGTDPAERIYELRNSYNIVIQYSKNDQNTYWKDTYQSLLNLKDGESL